MLIYSAWSGVNRVQVALSRFSVIFLRFVQAKMYVPVWYMYFLAALVLVYVDLMVICIGRDLNRCSDKSAV